MSNVILTKIVVITLKVWSFRVPVPYIPKVSVPQSIWSQSIRKTFVYSSILKGAKVHATVWTLNGATHTLVCILRVQFTVLDGRVRTHPFKVFFTYSVTCFNVTDEPES